jgi:hypothetical protein
MIIATMPQENSATPNQNIHPDPSPVTIVREPMKNLLAWKSPARPFEKKDREFYTTAGSIIFLACVVLLFIKEFLFIMAIVAFAFFYYILTTVPPEKVEHKLTNKGIFTIGKLYEWEQLGRFWFEVKSGSQVLLVENYVGLPPRLMILLADQKKEVLQKLLSKYLLLEKPEKTQMDKAADWIQKKVPLETSSKPQSARVKK